MAQLAGHDGTASLAIEFSEIGRSFRSSFRRSTSYAGSFRSDHSGNNVGDAAEEDERELFWAAIERLPTYDRSRTSLLSVVNGDINNDSFRGGDNGTDGRKVVDVKRLAATERHLLIEKLINDIEEDNLRLLRNLRQRFDRVGVKAPTVEVRYNGLSVDAKCQVVDGKPLPTLWNTAKGMITGLVKVPGINASQTKISILKDVSGIIKPSRLTLLLGPPGSGKTTLLLALAGKLDPTLKVKGEVSYNGYRIDEFVPQKTSAYISQYDLHIPEMTVRETLDFSARCQGVGRKHEAIMELIRKEKEARIVPDHDLDLFMKILGLDVCSGTIVGDVMRRGISGGQKKRLTTGEMIVGPTKTLFMDEISTGLDSSTTFQIVTCLQQFVHIADATVLISLLQPAPETFELFDDVILMAEGKIVYHGPRSEVLSFFEAAGFRCPERKGVISKKDQAQYWSRSSPYTYVTVDQFVERFRASHIGRRLGQELQQPFDRSQSHEDAISFKFYSLSKWELLKACMSREMLLAKRNAFVYIFKTSQLVFIAFITMTVFLRTTMHVDTNGAQNYMGAIFFSMIMLMVDSFPELAMTVSRLPVFQRQRDFYFYPAWAYSLTTAVWKIPHSLLESFIWTATTYYVIGYTPEAGRFFRQFLLFFGVHQISASLFRLVASVCQSMAAATLAALMSGWLKWSFWASPMSYAEVGIVGDEFLAPRWQKISSGNTTIGQQILRNRGLNFPGYFYWISVGAVFGFVILFYVAYTLALTYLKGEGSGAFISKEKLAQLQGTEEACPDELQGTEEAGRDDTASKQKKTGKMALPFQQLSMTFNEIKYFVDMPQEMRNQGVTERKLALLRDITGSFRPGILTALMGVSGAGKTTLMDVLAGRKTGGAIEGEVRIGGYPKVQSTFARISGYCEQNDIHSPHITVEESVVFSAWLRLAPEIDQKTKRAFVNEVLETIELDGIKDSLVGMPGVNGLSTEQRKRLTIAVELVANPSIIFMDEPTSGLDARAAAIVMRAVKNVVNTGRTVVCTIHQPSIDIFESFDELLLMKRGGQLIYAGPLGRNSSSVIEYFERIPGVPKIKDNYNPATWMLEVSNISMERQLNVDFAEIYRNSSLCRSNKELVNRLSTPPPGSQDLSFPTKFPQNGWGQFKACFWKLSLSYWRNPAYNLFRLAFIVISAVLLSLLFWKHGRKIDSQENLFSILGMLFLATIFIGVNNCISVFPVVAIERSVLYREKFAGMYASPAYAFAQVVIELPYVFVQAVIYGIITYSTVYFYGSAYKIFWYIFTMFMTLLYYTYLGMMVIALTPSVNVASILQSLFNTTLTLFAGFLIPGPQIPKWWIWMYWSCPTNWTLRAFFSSQYGDIQEQVDVFGEQKTVANFLKDYYGFHHDQLGLTAAMLIIYPLLFALLFALFTSKLSFQRR
ncbi:pleiotropic drug resistance protein 3-like [Nymphaea colorata]|nr:pleiotropic drug resistance protein 3-like [Nymphaea colorata]